MDCGYRSSLLYSVRIGERYGLRCYCAGECVLILNDVYATFLFYYRSQGSHNDLGSWLLTEQTTSLQSSHWFSPCLILAFDRVVFESLAKYYTHSIKYRQNTGRDWLKFNALWWHYVQCNHFFSIIIRIPARDVSIHQPLLRLVCYILLLQFF